MIKISLLGYTIAISSNVKPIFDKQHRDTGMIHCDLIFVVAKPSKKPGASRIVNKPSSFTVPVIPFRKPYRIS